MSFTAKGKNFTSFRLRTFRLFSRLFAKPKYLHESWLRLANYKKKLSKSKLIWSLNSPTTAIYLFQRFIWRPSIVKYEEWIPNELLTWMNAFWLWSTPLSVFLAPYSRSSYHFKHVFIKTPEMNILHTLNTFNSSVSKRDVSWILTQGSCQERRNDPIFMSVI